MNKHLTHAIAAAVLAVAVGSMGLVQQASGQFGPSEIWMTITNTKTGTVKMLKWELDSHFFESDISIDLDSLKGKKMEYIFGTTQFRFTWQMDKYEATWHDFKVVLGTDVQLGKPLFVTFTPIKSIEIFQDINADRSSDAIEVGSIKTFISTDNRVYTEGERALTFIGFIDASDRFIDPNSIGVDFEIAQNGDLVKRKLGSYTYMTPPLKNGDNQITLVLKRDGHNIGTESINIIVLPTVSIGERL